MNQFIEEIILQQDVLITIKEAIVTRNSGNITVRVHNIKVLTPINMAGKLTPKIVIEISPNVLHVNQYTIYNE